MSQVFAAINHRLSEEYGQIELQSQEAKDRHVTSAGTSIKVPHLTVYLKRMLADARFLHQKLSVLKNVSAPTNMLETLVAEKSIPRKSTLGSFRTTAGPNERLRGLLSKRDSTKMEKPLPSLTQPPLSPEGIPPQTASSNGTAADESVGESDRVIQPPRSGSRSTGGVPTRAEALMSVNGNGAQGDALQSEEELLGKSNPISSASSLQGALRDASGSNDDVQLAASPS